jgi:MOSC domain-containing protein YiiM
VDPSTGARDLAVVKGLMHNFGHTDCGVYAEVITGGDIARGDKIEAG